MDGELPEIITIQEASQYLRVPLSSLYKLVKSGKIPCQKVGRHWRFRKQALDRWLEEAQAVSGHPHMVVTKKMDS